MKDVEKNKKSKKRLKDLLANPSNEQRAEEILDLIRKRTASEKAKKFLKEFFDYIEDKI